MAARADISPAGDSQKLARARQIDARRKRNTRLYLLLPGLVIIGLFGLMPLSITLVYSFLKPGSYGGVEWVFSLDAYVQFFVERDIFDDSLSPNWAYISIFSRSIGLSFGATLGALILGFPTAYYIASKPAHQRNFWLFLITLPFWTNLLIRTYAMLIILRDQGVINLALMNAGITDKPISILYTDTAVFIGLIYSYLPFMVLPLYASLEKLDLRLIEAAYDLYASRFKVLTKVILPLAKPGIVAGCILVFIPGLGAYITPELLGGVTGIGYLMLAHTVFTIPFAYMPIRARLEDMTLTLEQAAADLYAPPTKVFWKVTFPLLIPGIVAGAMLAFVVSLDDVIITLMVAGPGETTLPIFILGAIRRGITPEINAVSTILLVASIIFVAIFFLVQKKRTK